MRRGRLGVIAIAFFVIAAAAPMAAVVAAGPILFSLVGGATPLVFVIAALLIALFSVGYLRMSRQITNAGGFVAYIDRGLGKKWATGGAGIAVFTYVTLQVGLWASYGVFTQQLVVAFTGVDLPPLLWILVTLALVTALTIRGVDASLKVLGVLIVAETVIIAILLGTLIIKNGLGVFSFAGFTAENIFSPALGIAFLFAFLCFTSFEATVVFSEEAINPRRTIPRALYAVIAFVGLFYSLSTWVISGAIGVDTVQEAATADPAGIVFALAADNAGVWLSNTMQVLVVTSYIAMMLGLNNMFSRYLFALGRAGVLHRSISRVSRRGAPATASLVNAAVVAIILAAFLLTGADAFTVVYYWFSALGTAGFVSILVLTSAAIVVYFRRNKSEGNLLVTFVAPTISFLVFLYIGYTTLINYDVLSGGAPAASWLLLGLPVLFVLGVVRALAKKNIDYSTERV
nr:APC family permease [Microbacterium sp. SORGH_AS_0888]